MSSAWLAIALLLGAGCKTAVEKRCDAMFDRVEACSGKELAGEVRSSAMMYCTTTLGEELEPGDTTSLAAESHRAIEQCSALAECGALDACFKTHQCQWILTSPDDHEPSFSCWK